MLGVQQAWRFPLLPNSILQKATDRRSGDSAAAPIQRIGIKFLSRYKQVLFQSKCYIDQPDQSGQLHQRPFFYKYSFNCLARRGWRKRRRALPSIWRMRSRVRPNFSPTSSNVYGMPVSSPKRILRTRASRGVRVPALPRSYP